MTFKNNSNVFFSITLLKATNGEFDIISLNKLIIAYLAFSNLYDLEVFENLSNKFSILLSIICLVKIPPFKINEPIVFNILSNSSIFLSEK